jgi:hypothetical protein
MDRGHSGAHGKIYGGRVLVLISAALPTLSQFSFCADRNDAQSRPCFCGESACNINRGDDTRFAELRTRRKRYLDSPRVVCRYHGCCLPIRDEGISKQDMKTRGEDCTSTPVGFCGYCQSGNHQKVGRIDLNFDL